MEYKTLLEQLVALYNREKDRKHGAASLNFTPHSAVLIFNGMTFIESGNTSDAEKSERIFEALINHYGM